MQHWNVLFYQVSGQCLTSKSSAGAETAQKQNHSMCGIALAGSLDSLLIEKCLDSRELIFLNSLPLLGEKKRSDNPAGLPLWLFFFFFLVNHILGKLSLCVQAKCCEAGQNSSQICNLLTRSPRRKAFLDGAPWSCSLLRLQLTEF